MNNNKNMNPIISLKNFRSFGEDGADFELAPITVLTGCNSAGKSSLVKALMLLSDQSTGRKIKEGYSDIDRIQPSTNLITLSNELKLGGFNNIINAQTKDDKLSFSYKIWSDYLQEEVVCKRIFRKKKNVQNEGILSMFTIEKTDGTIIYKSIPDYYIDDLFFDRLYQVCELEQFKEEDHFEIIEDQYRNFIFACLYIGLSERIEMFQKQLKKENLNINKKESLNKKIEELRIEQNHVKEQLGNISPDIYNDDIIKQWNEQWDMIFKERTELERIYFKQRTPKEEEKDNKELFYTLIINEAVSPWFIKSIFYIDSSTNEIRRIYNIENQDKLSILLWSLFKSRNSVTYQTDSFVNKWLDKFNLGDKIEITTTEEGMGVKVFLKKNGTKRLLADEGYGITQLISILLQIELTKKQHTSYDEYNGVNKNLKHVICIEEPEVHLHPKYQSMLADVFVEAHQKYNIHFIIETHSEYLIRKLQVMIANKSLKPEDVSLNYVEKNEEGVSYNRQIKINNNGRLEGSFGEGFYDEAGSLSRQLFMLND